MKKLFMLALLCLSFVASKAQLMVVNKTQCPICVGTVCYDQKCNIYNVCPDCTPVAPGGFIPLPVCPQCQFFVAYQVCWLQCPNFCVTVAPPPGNSCFPPQAVLQQCQCAQANVFFDAAGNLIVQ